MIQILNNGMEVWYDGKLVHSHHSNKVWSPSQVTTSIRRVMESKMPLHERVDIIRKGGPKKTALDDYQDSFVNVLEATLQAEAEKHRKALSYERMAVRADQLNVLLNGLPLTVDETTQDAEGVETTAPIPNPLREGYDPGHVMLDGLPLKIEQQTYDAEGNPTGTEMVLNPKREALAVEFDTVMQRVAKLLLNGDVQVIVVMRSGG